MCLIMTRWYWKTMCGLAFASVSVRHNKKGFIELVLMLVSDFEALTSALSVSRSFVSNAVLFMDSKAWPLRKRCSI